MGEGEGIDRQTEGQKWRGWRERERAERENSDLKERRRQTLNWQTERDGDRH